MYCSMLYHIQLCVLCAPQPCAQLSLRLSFLCRLLLQLQLPESAATAHRAALAESLASEGFPNLLHPYPSQTQILFPASSLTIFSLYSLPNWNGSKVALKWGQDLTSIFFSSFGLCGALNENISHRPWHLNS